MTSETDILDSIIFDYTENTQVEAWFTKEATPSGAKFQHNLLKCGSNSRGCSEIYTEIDTSEHARIADGYFFLHLRYVQYNPDDEEVLDSYPMIIRIYKRCRLPSRYTKQVHQVPLWIDPLDPNTYERTCRLSARSDDWESGVFLLAIYRARQPFSPVNIDGSELLDLYSPSKPGAHDSGCKPFLFASFKYDTSVDKDDNRPAVPVSAVVSSPVASGSSQTVATSTPKSKASHMPIHERDAAIDPTPSGSSKRAVDVMFTHDMAATPTGRIHQGFNKNFRPNSSGAPPCKKIRTEQPSKSSVNVKAIATSPATAVVRSSNHSSHGKERPTISNPTVIDLVSRSPTPEPVQMPEVHAQQHRLLPTLPQKPEFVKSGELQRLERQVEIAAKDRDAACERLEVLTEAARYRLEHELESYNRKEL